MWDRILALPRAGALALLVLASLPAQVRRPYIENFDTGPGGWYADRYSALAVWDGVAYCYGPWWVDANHAPPGAGYLHLLIWMYTDKRHYQGDSEYLRKLPYRGNRFAEENFSRDLTGARISVRMRGELEARGSQVVLLAQAKTPKTTANLALTGRPFRVTRDWIEQTVELDPDSKLWTCLGARHDMTGVYGCDSPAAVLADVNLDLIFILFPIEARPADPAIHEPDRLRALQDYPVDPKYLPKGLLMFDWVRIDYPGDK